jgi:hypothetical protein
MKKGSNFSKKLLIPLIGLAMIAGVACTPGNNFRDVEGVKSQDPDLIMNYNNMDKHPNIGFICIKGVAFFTTTRDFNAIGRVPEWDKFCPVK